MHRSRTTSTAPFMGVAVPDALPGIRFGSSSLSVTSTNMLLHGTIVGILMPSVFLSTPPSPCISYAKVPN